MTLYRGIDLHFTNDVMVLINEKDQVDHQKGLVARLLDLFGRVDAKDLEMELGQVSARLVREQVGGKRTGGR